MSDAMPASQGPGLPQSPDQVHGALGNAQAALKKGLKALRLLRHVQAQMDTLMKLEDSVEPEDVVNAAGALVAQGANPMQLASLLADMPDQPGEALAGWIAQQDAITQKNAAMIQQTVAQQQHALGVAALHSLVHHSMGGEGPEAPPAPNPLMGA